MLRLTECVPEYAPISGAVGRRLRRNLGADKPPRHRGASMMICQPRSEISPSIRDSTSAPPPGGKPTIQRIGLAGQVCAEASAPRSTSIAAIARIEGFIFSRVASFAASGSIRLQSSRRMPALYRYRLPRVRAWRRAVLCLRICHVNSMPPSQPPDVTVGDDACTGFRRPAARSRVPRKDCACNSGGR